MANIDTILYQISWDNPFYGEFLLNIRRISNTTKLDGKPIGIWIDGLQIYMALDEAQFEQMTDKEAKLHIKHALFHLFLRHIPRSQMFDKKIYHAAADIVLNQQIPGSEKISQLTYENLKLDPNLTAEEYYEKIEDMGDDGGGLSTVDADYKWEDASEGEINHAVREAIKRAMDRGEVPSELQSLIPDWLKTEPLPWYMLVRYFGFSLYKMRSNTTWKRKNRRIKGVPGIKKKPFIKLAVAVDTSGSMSDDDIALCFKQIEYLNQMCTLECWVIECDAQVHKTYKYTGTPPSVTGRGGTAFTPAIEWAAEKRVNGMIYLTDGYGDDPYPPPFPVLWVLTPEGNEQCASFGQKIKMPEKSDNAY